MMRAAALSFLFLWPLHTLVHGIQRTTKDEVSVTNQNLPRSIPPTITAPPSASQTPSYDPDACGASWIDYVRNDISTYSQFWRQFYKYQIWEDKYALENQSGLENSSDYWSLTHEAVVTMTSIIRREVATQCDRFPRVSSVGESAWLSTITTTDYKFATSPGAPPWEGAVPNPGGPRGLSGPYPSCEIRPRDCQSQWDRFHAAFPRGSIGLEALGNLSSELGPSGAADYVEVYTPDMLDIDRWVAMREYSHIRGFFATCHQPIDVCYDYAGDAMTDKLTDWSSSLAPRKSWSVANPGKVGPYSMGFPTPPTCWLYGDRFVLIHFPVSDHLSKNLCGDNSTSLYRRGDAGSGHDNVTMIATLDSIVFQAKTLVGMDGAFSRDVHNTDWEFHVYLTIPASTMRLPNDEKWTFTSPSAYIAYDKIYATGECSQPGRVLQDGILSLNPTEVMTMTSYDDGWSAKTVEFADFQGPPAASAYDQLADGPMAASNVWPASCHGPSRTICEDLFFPRISLPAMVTSLEPAWAACEQGDYSNWVWDPPIVMKPTPFVAAASITIKPKDNGPEKPTAIPGMLGSSPMVPPTPSPRLGLGFGQGADSFDDNPPANSKPARATSHTPSEQAFGARPVFLHDPDVQVMSNGHPLNSQVYGQPVSVDRNGHTHLVAANEVYSINSEGRTMLNGVVLVPPTTKKSLMVDQNGQTLTMGVDTPSRTKLTGSVGPEGRQVLRVSAVHEDNSHSGQVEAKGALVESSTVKHGRKKNQALSVLPWGDWSLLLMIFLFILRL